MGDLRGVIDRLDYIADLGVNAIWLSPIFESPMHDFGYDISDYCAIDPVFGSLGDLDELLGLAHARNIRVILDWVPNHTSIEHPWFKESRSSLDNPRRDWYVWRERGHDGALPNNWVRAWSDLPAWTLDSETGQYYLHCFLPEQPDLNWDKVEVRAAMKDVMKFWLDRGIDGFRMDVVHLIGKEVEANDDPELAGLTHVALNDVGVTHDYLREIRATLDAYDDRVSIGEVVLFDPERVATYYGNNDELHLSFNFASLMTPWRAKSWAELITITEATHQKVNAWPTWVLSNHDNVRVASRLGGHREKVRSAFVLLLTLRGTPFLYAGEELGLLDAVVPPERVVDPGGRDGCRAPIPWTTEEGYGWAEPWLPFVEDAASSSVAAQTADDDSVLAFARRLLAVRATYAALRRGDIENVVAEGDVLSFERCDTQSRLRVIINFGPDAATLEAPGTNVLTSHRSERHELAPYGAVVIALD